MRALRGIVFVMMTCLGYSLSADVYHDECANLIGSCEYYSCIEANRLSCGASGYALGYGKAYCERFSAIDFKDARTPFGEALFPASGNVWRDNVRQCLQQSLEAFFATDASKTCGTVRAFAFNSHPECYTQSPSFCDLTPENVARIGLTIQPQDLWTQESLTQVRDTARICVTQYDDRIALEDRPLIKFYLNEYRKIWVVVAGDPKKWHTIWQTERNKLENF